MLQYEIAGLRVSIISDYSSKFKRLKPFECSFSEIPDIEIIFQSSGYFAEQNYNALDDDGIAWHVEEQNGAVISHVYLKKNKRTEYKIIAENNWSNVTILYHAGETGYEAAFCAFLGNFIISNKILYHDGLVLHASALSYNGKGIAFTAPSGSGKTTHAVLWEKRYHAAVLNDDCPIIRCINGKAMVYGTPWSGSRHKCINSSAPLAAIVVIEQAPENSIQPLTIQSALPLLLPRLFLPFQNPSMMDVALSNAEKIVNGVSLYLLKCRPDIEAAELVHKCII